MGKKIKPVVYTILIAFNNELDVKRVLRSLDKQKTSNLYQLKAIVGDNSTDKTKKSLIAKECNRFNFVTYLDLKRNTGFAQGNNLAVAKVANEADYLFLLNIDTEIKKDCLNNLLKAQNETEAAVVGPLIVYGDDENTNWYSGGQWHPWLAAFRMGGRNKPVNKMDTRRSVTFINGAGMFMPITTYLKYDLFFEPYFMYYEEGDYCARLLQAGESLIYEPRAVVKHYLPKSTTKNATHVYYLVRNQWLFWARSTKGFRKFVSFFAVIVLQKIHFFRYIFQADIRKAIWEGTTDAKNKNYGPRKAK